MLVSVSCYSVKEKSQWKDICVIHSQRWEFSSFPIEISTGSTYEHFIKFHSPVRRHHEMRTYVLSIFPGTDLKFINSGTDLKFINSTACQKWPWLKQNHVTHFLHFKQCPSWNVADGGMNAGLAVSGPKKATCDVDRKVPGVVREK